MVAVSVIGVYGAFGNYFDIVGYYKSVYDRAVIYAFFVRNIGAPAR